MTIASAGAPAPAVAPQPRPALPRGVFARSATDVAPALHLVPTGMVEGPDAAPLIEAGLALPLAGDPARAFTAVGLRLRPVPETAPLRACASLAEARAWARDEGPAVAHALDSRLARLGHARPPFAGLALPPGRPLVMGIVNATPDSFSDGGDHATPQAALAHALALLEAGADVLDIGGESTRPGSASVSPAEEIERVVPVIRALAERGAVVSVDTRNTETMAAALDAGARILNDINALRAPGALALAAARKAPVVIMHMQGEPGTMQADPRYHDAALDVCDWLDQRLDACRAAGLDDALLAVDPGLGFGKTLDHNLEIMADLGLLLGLGTAVLVGASRKRFIGAVTGVETARDRLAGSLVVAETAARRGAHFVRVHDVAETVQALAMGRAL
ncbi:dihydropteroate synthase [Pararhodospirillum oryzae]|uniref:dihydropteroate synthase n=1 Tax=Pararhodospirillum oryzae TaxID=478448 RepID=A0A512H5C7_9PROT|nr:dihydropteroate synthase [Pararhodospirillum oryzae]GEO80672.1 dihydropteroate synthase [Pararhodospirillum oryzae]